MKCFVTGATGFIGSYVVKSLVEAGNEVIALYHSSAASRWLDGMLTEEERERLKFVQGDMTDSEMIKRLIVDHGCDTVAHLASKLNQKTRANPTGAVRTNIVAFQELLEICRKERIKKIVWASSSAVYGIEKDRKRRYGERDAEIMDEDTALCPGSLYSYTKTFNEGLSEFYRKEYGMDSIGLRVNLSYGPYIHSSFQPFFSSIIDNPAIGVASKVPYSDTMFDFQYAGDIADTFRAALVAPPTKHGISNTRGEYRSVGDAIDYIRKILPEADIQPAGGDMGIPFHFDTSALEREIGYLPSHTMEQGLLKSINMVRKSSGLKELQ